MANQRKAKSQSVVATVGVLVAQKANDAQQTFFNLLAPKDADALLASASIRKINARLEEKRAQGYSGWQTSSCNKDALKARVQACLDGEDYLDAAILLLMLEQREELGIN